MHAFSYEANKIRKQKSHLLLELQAVDQIKEKFHESIQPINSNVDEQSNSKSSFGMGTLTER